MKKIPALILMLTLIISVTPAIALAATGEDVASVTTEADMEPVISETFKNITPNIDAASSGLTSIKVKWDKIEGASGYMVYRAASKSGKWSLVKTVTSGDTLSYTNTGRTTGKTYYYKVRAYVKEGSTKYYSKYSNVDSAYSRPLKVKNLKVKYENLHGVFNLTWGKVSGASGYEIKIRKPGDLWRSYYLYDDGEKYYPDDLTTGEESRYIKGTKANVYPETHYDYFDFKVRAYKTVNGKKVFGLYSDEFRIEGTTTKEEIQNAVHNWVRENYPGYKYYDSTVDDYGNNVPLTEKNGSFFFTWSFWSFNQYDSMDYVMDIMPKKLYQDFNNPPSYPIDEFGNPNGYFYMKEIEHGKWQCWWLC